MQHYAMWLLDFGVETRQDLMVRSLHSQNTYCGDGVTSKKVYFLADLLQCVRLDGKKVEEYLGTAEALNRLPELDLNTGVYSNHISDLSQPCAFKQLFMLITRRFTAVTRNIKQHFGESGTAAHYAVSIDWIIIQHMEIRRTIVYQCQLEFLRAEDLINLFFYMSQTPKAHLISVMWI